MKTLPRMIRIVRRELNEETLEAHASPDFIDLVGSCLHVVKPGASLGFNHHMFALDLDWGYPESLWREMIPIVRSWIERNNLPADEVCFPSFNRQWWLFLRKR